MIDPTSKEELIRAQLSHLGFDLEKDGFDYSVRGQGHAGATTDTVPRPCCSSSRYEHRYRPVSLRVCLFTKAALLDGPVPAFSLTEPGLHILN
jgi:hypothetical protein